NTLAEINLGDRRFAGHEKRHQTRLVAGFVEILQVQRVVPNLIPSGSRESFFSNLELDHKHNMANRDHGVDAFAEPRYCKFKVDKSRFFHVVKSPLKQFHLAAPRLRLFSLNRKSGVGSQMPYDRRGLPLQEIRNRL